MQINEKYDLIFPFDNENVLDAYEIIHNIFSNLGITASVFQSTIVSYHGDEYEIEDGFKVEVVDCEEAKLREAVNLIKTAFGIEKVLVRSRKSVIERQ